MVTMPNSFVQLQRLRYWVTLNDRQFDATQRLNTSADRIHQMQRIPQFRSIEIDDVSGDFDLSGQNTSGRFERRVLRRGLARPGSLAPRAFLRAHPRKAAG